MINDAVVFTFDIYLSVLAKPCLQDLFPEKGSLDQRVCAHKVGIAIAKSLFKR